MTRKEYSDYYKKQHRCIVCGKKDRRTLSGFSTCEKCATKLREYHRNYYHTKGKAKREAKNRAVRLKRIEEHLCLKCGAKLPDGYTFRWCEACREKSKLYQRENYGSVRKYER